MNKARILRFGCAQGLLVAAAFSTHVYGLNANYWDGAANNSSNYNDTNNWSQSRVPISTDQAEILSGSAQLTASPPTVGGMLVSLSGQFLTGSYKLTCSGTVDADAGGFIEIQDVSGGGVALSAALLEATGDSIIQMQYSNSNASVTSLSVQAGSEFKSEGTLSVSGTYTNNGTLLNDYGTTITAGTFTMSGTSSQPATVSANGQTIAINAGTFNLGSYASIDASAYESNLTLNNTSSGFSAISSTMTVGNTAQVSLTGGEWQFNSTVNLNGGTSLSAAATINDYAAYDSNVNVTGYANMIAGEFDGGAAVNVASGGALYVASPYFRGTSSNTTINFTGSGNLYFSGATAIGYSSNGIPYTVVNIGANVNFNLSGGSGANASLDIQNGELNINAPTLDAGGFLNAYSGSIDVEGGSTLNVAGAAWLMVGPTTLGPGAKIAGQSMDVAGAGIAAPNYAIMPETYGGTPAIISAPLDFISGYIYMNSGSSLHLDGATTYAGGGVTSVPYVGGEAPYGSISQDGNATVTANTILFCDVYDMDGTNNTATWTINAGESLTQQSWYIDSPATSANLFHSTITLNGGTLEMETNTGEWTLAGGTINMNISNSDSAYIGGNELILGTGSTNGTINVGAGTLAYVGSGLHSGANTVSGGNVVNVGAGAYLYVAFAFGSDANAVLTKTGPGIMWVESGISESHGAGSVINVNQGTLELDSNVGTATSGTLSINVAGTFLAGSDQHLASLHVENGGLVTLASGANKVLRTSSLTIDTGGTLDITNDGMILDYTGSSPLLTIRSEIAAAYDKGLWDKPGITSSTALTKPGTAIGYADNAQFHYTTFDNQTISTDDILFKFTWYGDLNLDGKVNSADLALMNSGAGWGHGDLNYDGVDNADDYSLYQLGDALQDGSIGATVPEPAIVAMAVPMLSIRANRRKYAR